MNIDKCNQLIEVIESMLEQTDEYAITDRKAAEKIYKDNKDKATVGFKAIIPY
jgi:hypothetical protein